MCCCIAAALKLVPEPIASPNCSEESTAGTSSLADPESELFAVLAAPGTSIEDVKTLIKLAQL
jgi:hypothetical protein